MASAGKTAGSAREPKALVFIEDGSFIYDNRVRREVKTLEDAGYQVTVICPRYPGERWVETVGSTVVYHYWKPSLGAGIVGHACEYACSLLFGGLLSVWVAVRRGFDVIQLCNPPDFLFPIAGFFTLFGKKYIFDHHDLCPELFGSRYGEEGVRRRGLKDRFVDRVLRFSERRSWRLADAVISTNESYRRAAIERGGVDPEKVVVVRNGPDLERYSEWREPERKEHVRVGYIGNMNPQDGVDYLLRAAHHIRKEKGRTDVDFVLIGKGDSFNELNRLKDELGLADCVRFTGRISDEEVFSQLSACDIGCQPDPRNPLNDVSTMNKAKEYMALAKPVVAFDLVETRVSCGEAALYAERNDASELGDLILRLADDFDLRRRMGLEGRRRIEEELAWKYSTTPYLSIYRRVLGLPECEGAGDGEPNTDRSNQEVKAT